MVCSASCARTSLPWVTTIIAIAYGVYVTYRLNKSANCSGRCNKDIDMNNEKIINTVDIEDIDEKAVYCRCWKSKKFPLCDGSHNKHNETTGDNVGPLIVQKNN